jgi:hypothetical protein
MLLLYFQRQSAPTEHYDDSWLSLGKPFNPFQVAINYLVYIIPKFLVHGELLILGYVRSLSFIEPWLRAIL